MTTLASVSDGSVGKDESSKTSTSESSEHVLVAWKARLRKVPIDLIVLFVSLLVVWVALLLPIIYFHTDIEIEGEGHNATGHNASINGSHVYEATRDNCSRSCTENFFCLPGEEMGAEEEEEKEQLAKCVPNCPSWSDYPQTTATAIDVLVIVFACVGLVGAVGVIVISCLRHKHVFTFPTVFVFYETITITVLLVLFLLNYVARGPLYCASENLLDSIYVRSTPFCTISGMVLYYCMLQLNLWWVFHVTVLFWKIQFPLHALRYTNKKWRVHLALVIAALSAPLLPVLVTMIHSQTPDYRRGGDGGIAFPSGVGFGMATFPPILCYILDKDVVFFSFILPVVLLMYFGITILLFTIWAVHKQHGLFKARSRSHHKRPKKASSKVGVAEKKLLLVFVYYFLFTVVSYTGFSLFQRKVERYNSELMTYFQCEEGGYDPQNPCDRSRIEFLSFPGATAIAYVLIELSPLVNFVFIINFQQLKLVIEQTSTSMK